MNKILLLVFAFILFPATVTTAQNFRGGLLAGLSMNQVDGDTYSGYFKPGFIGGFFVDKPFSEKFVLEMELKFIQKGARTSYNIDTESGEFYRIQLNYVQLPVMAQYNFGKNFWGELGLGFGYLISSKEEDSYGEIGGIAFRKTEFLGAIGVAYYIPNTKLRVNLRATNSIIPIRTNSNIEAQSYWKRKGQYNRNLELTLALLLK